MKRMNKPNDNAIDVFTLCISKVRNANLKKNLGDITQLINQAAIEYDQHAQNADLYLVPQSIDINENITKVVMEKVYTQRMAKESSPGRNIYDRLRSSADFNQCPLCGHRQVKTLDHYLPKANYSKHVVMPFNLIPACSDCNKDKLDAVFSDKESQTLHPYYDNVTEYQWLFAEIIEGEPISVRFYTQEVSEYDDILNSRIKNHFNAFKLNSLYVSQSGVLLANLRYRVIDLYEKGGAEAVSEYFGAEAESRVRNCLNSWETAIYLALSESEWYCNGGFR
ncbi:HNH endonuclease [Enterobacter ludwigii]